jgi:tetratricopeptide (TPR) repeat protein
MQRYRVNYRLLFGLVIGFLAAAPALYFLWSFQVDRNATRLIKEASIAQEKGEYEEAFDNLSQYVKLRKQDPNGFLQLGQVSTILANQENLSPELMNETYLGLVESVLRTTAKDVEWEGTPDEVKAKQVEVDKLRRSLIKVHMQYGYGDRALTLIDELIAEGHEDGELDSLKAQCLYGSQDMAGFARWGYEVIGYNPQTKAFDRQPRAADQPLVYYLLARYLGGSNQIPAAEAIIVKMVEANPKSLEAYNLQYQFYKAIQKSAEARAALAEAIKLDPNDAAVLQGQGIEAIDDYRTTLDRLSEEGADRQEIRDEANAHLDKAAEFFAQGMEKYPQRIDFYFQAARIETFRERFDKALAIIDKGIKQFDMTKALNALGMPVAIDLENQKIDILLQRNDIAAVEAEIKMLRGLRNSRVTPIAEYFEARIQLAKNNWLEAARQLNSVKARLIGSTSMQALASTYEALCRKQLGQLDLALEAARWAAEKDPNLGMAQAIIREVQSSFGQTTDDTAVQFDELIQKVLELPPNQQNWDNVQTRLQEYVQQQAELQGRDQVWIDGRIQLLTAQMYVTRALAAKAEAEQAELFAKAREAVLEAHRIDPNDVAIQLAAPRLLAMQPGKGPAAALKLLDQYVADNQKKGIDESLQFRKLRVDILFALRDEQLPNQLNAATEGIEKWSTADQADLWAAVAVRFEQLDRLADAELCLKQAAKLAPTLLPYRVALFELARKQADNEAMRAAQKQILEIVKSENDPDYIITEVKRLMVNYATGAITQDQLRRARALLTDAIRQRRGWADLYVLSSQLALVLEKDPKLALDQLDLALKNGPSNVSALNLQIRILADRARYAEARNVMDRLPKSSWTQVLDRTAADVLQRVGETEAAFLEAKKLADANPNDPQTLVWFGGVAGAAGEFAAAETAFRKAVDINPSDPEMWSTLLNYYMTRQQGPQVEATLREAQLALDEEFLTLLTAQQNRLFGRFPQAESIFVSAYSNRLDDPQVNQRMAEFYLAWGEFDPTKRALAAPYLNRLLKIGYDDKSKQNDSIVAWGRRQAARLFSLRGDYQDSLKAEQLLAGVAAGPDAAAEDQEMLVDILNRRGDPASRLRAIDLLKSIQKQRGLQPAYELLLGEALAGVGRWSECERHMQDAITRHPDDLALRVGLIEMLIDRKDAVAAESWLQKLDAIPGGRQAVPQLRIRLAAAQGKKEQVRKMLESITPNLTGVLSEDQLRIIYSVALLANNVGDNEYALKLMTAFARRIPGHELELAQFTALYGDVELGFNMLRELFPARMDDVLPIVVEILRRRRLEAPEKLDEIVNQMVGQARRNDPEAARRMVLEAESLEIQQRFKDAIDAYRRILERDDVPKVVRASALNNQAFLLAMMKQDLDKALENANEAMEILGPISDILDTRALVYLHRGEADKAVQDLQLAVMIGATASKYFHLAEAYLAAGNESKAQEAWKEALARNISVETTPVVEQPDLKELMQKMESLQGGVARN